jgi:NAD(P)-dependent dehydrogenase (short-subunit alcohol dehydrogenase family)
MGLTKCLLREGQNKGISVTAIIPSRIKTPMYRRTIEASTVAWVKDKEIAYDQGVEVDNVADIALLVATRDKNVIIPQLAVYPRNEIHKYGMNV